MATNNKKKTVRRKAPVQKRADATVKRRAKNHPKLEDFFNKSGDLKNPKHEMFAHAWVQSFDHEFACNEARIKVKNRKDATHKSCSLLRREDVQVRVRSILKERVRDMALTESWVVLELLDTYNKCSAMREIYTQDGEPTGDKAIVDARGALKALEMLGQNIGMFKTKSDGPAQNITLNLNYGSPQKDVPLVGQDAIEGVSKRLQ
jgi:hypothetical protein